MMSEHLVCIYLGRKSALRNIRFVHICWFHLIPLNHLYRELSYTKVGLFDCHFLSIAEHFGCPTPDWIRTRQYKALSSRHVASHFNVQHINCFGPYDVLRSNWPTYKEATLIKSILNCCLTAYVLLWKVQLNSIVCSVLITCISLYVFHHLLW